VRRAAAPLLAALVLAACGSADKETPPAAATPKAPVIRLGTKNFTEQYILGELYKQALEAKGFKVNLKENIGATEIIDSALTLDSLDMYAEYTGVLLSEIAQRQERPASRAAAYRDAKAFEEGRGYTLLEMTPFEDSNALAVKPAFARRHGLHTIADLAKVPGKVKIGAPPEFRTRFEGLIGLQKLYGLKRVSVTAVPIGEQYARLNGGKVDVALAFTTAGQLSAGRYEVLEDSKRLFGFQNIAPVVSKKMLAAAPGMAPVVNAVSATLTTDAMRELNAAVDQRGEAPAKVAADFLKAQGLV
jgi:osmoprotectant transport system substrate-binding protein